MAWTFSETVLGFEQSGLLDTLVLLLTVKKHHQMPTNPIIGGVWKEFAQLHVKHIDGGCNRKRLAIDPLEGYRRRSSPGSKVGGKGAWLSEQATAIQHEHYAP
jgi:hypothetical protein